MFSSQWLRGLDVECPFPSCEWGALPIHEQDDSQMVGVGELANNLLAWLQRVP